MYYYSNQCVLFADKFTGKERDSESALDNFGARYDSSQYGRFMTPDPMGNAVADPSNPQSWNQYSYVINNPVNLVDPTGLDWCEGAPGVSPGECSDSGGTWHISNGNQPQPESWG